MNDNIETMAAVGSRIHHMRFLARRNTRAIRSFMHLPPQKKLWGKKRNNTDVTILDYEIEYYTAKYYLPKFPKDSFYGEESPIIRSGIDGADKSEFSLYEDPVDATTHAVTYDPAFPKKKCWATYMVSLTHRGVPVAFAFGVPLRKEIYSGSVFRGASFNRKPMKFEIRHEAFMIDLDRARGNSVLKELTGHDDLHIAGLCVWLILNGYTVGGICPFPLPHESCIIAAAARSVGAKVTDSAGGDFHPEIRDRPLVWSFDEADHKLLLNKANSKEK